MPLWGRKVRDLKGHAFAGSIGRQTRALRLPLQQVRQSVPEVSMLGSRKT